MENNCVLIITHTWVHCPDYDVNWDFSQNIFHRHCDKSHLGSFISNVFVTFSCLCSLSNSCQVYCEWYCFIYMLVSQWIQECLSAISFSKKGSRYICSGGTGQIVKIWDLQRKLCIKKLRGHTSTITGVMYNCKDEHLASVSVGGDLIVHNLASGARATELKDPNGQVVHLVHV